MTPKEKALAKLLGEPIEPDKPVEPVKKRKFTYTEGRSIYKYYSDIPTYAEEREACKDDIRKQDSQLPSNKVH